MPKLVYLAAARRDIAEIARYIEQQSLSRNLAESFVDKLTDYCEKIAGLTARLGRARPEFGSNYRSLTFGSYVIFFRYVDDDGLQSLMIIVHVVHGARDLDAYFARQGDET